MHIINQTPFNAFIQVFLTSTLLSLEKNFYVYTLFTYSTKRIIQHGQVFPLMFLLVVSLVLMQYAHGQTMTQEQREVLVNYCFQHADRPNPIQDLIDKGFLSEGFKETCLSVKQAYDNEQGRIAEEIKNQNNALMEKYLKYEECNQNVTLMPKDCEGIISYEELTNLIYNGSFFQ